MTFRLSPSSISLMHDCPRCFWMEQHDKWKRPAGIFPSLPSGMDRILKKHFDNFRDKNELPPELKEAGDVGEMEGVRLFGKNDDEKNLLDIWRNNRKGLQVRDAEGNILKGAVDNILVKDGKLIVLDYKTRGYPLKEDTHCHYQNQLDLYSFLLKAVGYEVQDYAYLLFYIPKEVLESGEVIFDTNLVKMKVSVQDGQNLFENALKLLKSECPEKHSIHGCEWCRFIE